MIKKLLYLMAVLLPWVANAKLMDVGYFELDNGLKVAVISNHKAPVVLQMLYYHTGSINDPKGKGGVAHLLEHLMFRGTKKVKDKEFNRLTDLYGAENNAFTTYNVTGYYEFSDISKLELMMALEADRMANLEISDEAFSKERDVVLEERYQRFETSPATLFYENLHKLLWQEHPMANPVSGYVAEIKNLTKNDALDFYHKWYGPDNALLILSGDITVDEGRRVAYKYYNDVKPRIAKAKENELAQLKANKIDVHAKIKGIEQARFSSYRYIQGGSLEKKDVVALDILALYLAGDDTSYLYDKLVYEDKKFLAIDVGFGYDEKLGGTFSFYAVPTDSHMYVDEIFEIIDNNIENGISALTSQKVEQIKQQMLVQTIYLQENPEKAARFVGDMLLDGYSIKEIENFDDFIKSITLDDVVLAWEKIKLSKVLVNGYLENDDEK